MTLISNLHRQLAQFRISHINEPRFLVLDPENYRGLCRELRLPGPMPSGSVMILGLAVVVIPIPETFYIAADPDVEVHKYVMQHEGA